MIAKGSTVHLEYALFIEEGVQVDGNVGEKPFVFTMGKEQILPSLEEALMGMKTGETQQIVLSPEDGYGPVQEEGFREVAIEEIPEDARTVGTLLTAESESGQELHLRVHEVNEESVILDMNHPLAGHTLTFDIKILDVE